MFRGFLELQGTYLLHLLQQALMRHTERLVFLIVFLDERKIGVVAFCLSEWGWQEEVNVNSGGRVAFGI